MLRCLSAVDDAKHLLVPAELLRQRLIRQRSRLTEAHPAEFVVQRRRLRAQLCDGTARRVGAQQIAERGLRGRAEHERRAKALRKRRHGRHAGPQMRKRQHLRFVEDDNAVRKVMELAALRRAVCVQRFEKLHRRGHHHRHIPVFRGQRAARLLRRSPVGQVELHAGVVLEHIAAAQDLPEHFGVLLDDRRIRHDVDHALHSVCRSVPQRKGERRDRLSAAGRHRQSVNAFRFTARIHAGVQDLAAQAVQLRFRFLPRCDVVLQPLDQYRDLIVSAAAAAAVHERFGIQKVRVHQAGIKHSDPERELQHVPFRRFGRQDRQRRAAFAAALEIMPLRSLFAAAEKSGFTRAVAPAAGVQKSAVMPRDARGGAGPSHPHAGKHPCRGVVYPRPAAQQPVLKTVRALAEVVRKSHEPALRFRAEIGGKHAAQRRRPFKMLRDRLAAQAVV